jgi:hypothetical protein
MPRDGFSSRAPVVAAALMAAGLAWPAVLSAQVTSAPGPGSATPGAGCACGAHPPGRPPDWVATPYAGEPQGKSAYSTAWKRRFHPPSSIASTRWESPA